MEWIFISLLKKMKSYKFSNAEIFLRKIKNISNGFGF
jgi:hypothetical protein